MKKFVAVSLVVLTVLGASACSKSSVKAKELDKNFTCKAVITQDKTKYEVDLQRIDGAGWDAVFTAPETIAGMEISLLNDKCTVNFKELSYTTDRENLPQNGAIALVTGTVDKCIAGKGIETTQNGKTLEQTGDYNTLDFRASIKEKNVTKVEIADEITAEFSDYKSN